MQESGPPYLLKLKEQSARRPQSEKANRFFSILSAEDDIT